MADGIDAILAADLARHMHRGQTDKAGEPYVEHLRRVAWKLHPEDYDGQIVAWLHDIVEDTDLGLIAVYEIFGDVVGEAVRLLTRDKDDRWASPLEYYERIRNNPLALRVKRADIADNADEQRLAKLDPETADRLRRKYTKAREALGQPEGVPFPEVTRGY